MLEGSKQCSIYALYSVLHIRNKGAALGAKVARRVSTVLQCSNYLATASHFTVFWSPVEMLLFSITTPCWPHVPKVTEDSDLRYLDLARQHVLPEIPRAPIPSCFPSAATAQASPKRPKTGPLGPKLPCCQVLHQNTKGQNLSQGNV